MKSSARPMYDFRSLRWTTASSMPCSSRNSLRWKPGGSLVRMVCSITRGPANPISAPGSANVQIAQHSERRGHSAGRGIGEHGNIRHSRFIQPRQRRRNLRQLHQADHAFHHARAAGSGNNDQRRPGLLRLFDGSSDQLADHRTHAAADERILHGADDHRPPV